MLDIASALEIVLKSREDVRSGPSDIVNKAAEKIATDILACVSEGPDSLTQELKIGLREAARRIDRVSIAVTGLAWLGSGVSSLDQEIISLIRGARREIALCAYTITPSAESVLAALAEAVNQGIFATIALNSFCEQATSVQEFLRNLDRSCPDRCRVRDFEPVSSGAQLHAKVLVADRSTALVGSANLSFHGMTLNHEMALIVHGPTAENVAARLDLLLQRAQPVPMT